MLLACQDDLPGFFGGNPWMDATNVDLKQNTTLSNGGSISQWKDQSGNGKHLTVINTANSGMGSMMLYSSGFSPLNGSPVNSHYLWDFRDG